VIYSKDKKQKFPYNSAKTIYNNQLIVAGGDYDIADIDTNITYKFIMDINQKSNMVELR